MSAQPMHTPGPWTAYCRSVLHVEGQPWPEDEFLQWEIVGPRVPSGRGEFFEADARLIAAAPELLLAAQGLIGKFERLAHYDDEKAAIAEAQAIVAKATGGAHG